MKRSYRESSKPQLQDHIRAQMRNGVSLNSIIKSLREAGWQDNHIQQAMQKLNQQNKAIQKERDEKAYPTKSHKKTYTLIVFSLLSALVLYLGAQFIIRFFNEQLDQSQSLPLDSESRLPSDIFRDDL